MHSGLGCVCDCDLLCIAGFVAFKRRGNPSEYPDSSPSPTDNEAAHLTEAPAWQATASQEDRQALASTQADCQHPAKAAQVRTQTACTEEAAQSALARCWEG